MKTYSDSRLDDLCTHCGSVAETRDHIPPKVFLDEPYPDELMVVGCCSSCNSGLASDEEYFSCLIECVLGGTTEPDKLQREKIRHILSKKASLRNRLEQAKSVENDGTVFFRPEGDRIKSVILKLARGHAKYENSSVQFDEPIHFWITPLFALEETDQQAFLSVEPDIKFALWPEVGSRAMQRVLFVEGVPSQFPWISVQPGSYEFAVSIGSWNPLVKILIRDYLAAEVGW